MPDDDEVNWEGRAERDCGEHRTCGLRAWCHDCGEWCSEMALCRGCDALIHVAWRNERTGALHARKFGFERDGGPGRGWVRLYAYRSEVESARARVGKRT